jgi:hypothetical protein
MATVAHECERSQRPEIGGFLVLSWIVLGTAMIAGVVALGGWRLVFQIWLASALVLGVLLLRDFIVERRHNR